MNKDEALTLALEARLFDDDMENYSDRLENFANLVAAAEREACAKVADDAKKYNRHISKEIAEAIRARGNK